MLLVKIVAFAVCAATCISIVIVRSDRWALSLQRYYIRESQKLDGDSEDWLGPWIRTLFRCMVIFFGLMAVVGLYVAFFNLPQATPAPDVSTPSPIDHCSSILSLDKSRALIARLDHSEPSFASTTQDVMGRTTEGGEQTTYTQDGVRQIVEQRFYAETGRAIARIYYTSGTPFALIVQNMKYAVPLSVDNNGDVQSTEERAYFLDDTGVVCSWLLNGKPQPIEANTVDSVKSYLAGVL
jgi:hypothetical protein